ncbi:MAG: YihY/virulence factor BrkB family protein, partial [Lacticaseibacillus rhamnosus]
MGRKKHPLKRSLLSAKQAADIRSGRTALADMKLPNRTKFWVFINLAI